MYVPSSSSNIDVCAALPFRSTINTHTPLPLPRSPPLAHTNSLRSPRWQDFPSTSAAVAATVGANDTIQFTIPEGLGALRAISVIVRSGTSGSAASSASSNTFLFSYDTPVISFVELRTLDEEVVSQLSAPPAPNSVILSAHGFNFGPARSVFNDAVNRTLLIRPTTASGGPLPGKDFSTDNVVPVGFLLLSLLSCPASHLIYKS